MAVGDKYKLRVQWRNNALNLTAENSFAYEALEATIFDTQEEDLVEAFRFTAEAEYINCVQNTWFIEQYLVAPLPLEQVTFQNVPGVVAGTLSGDPMPPQIACVVTIRSGEPGRSKRGRVYLPPANEANNTSEGLVAGSYITLAQSFINEALLIGNSIDTATYALGIWSEKLQTFVRATHGVPKNKWATQRGRTR